ncbi:MAG: PQQ-binding-like beta-propeller repeat protein [Planctomycetaceae bacterium]
MPTPIDALNRLFRRTALCLVTVVGVAIVGDGLGGTARGFDKKASSKSVAKEIVEVMARAEAEKRRRDRLIMEEEAISKATAAKIEAALLELDGRIMVESMASKRAYFPSGYAVPSSTVASGQLIADTSKADLKTNPEHERDLVRADEYARKGKYHVAIAFWQRVLNESSDTVMTRDDWEFKASRHTYRKFRSVADEVERNIAKLPPDGLRTYRLKADGEARALLSGDSDRREEALSAVVRRFFLSSYGDDAAFELACRKMDRSEFVGASRMLLKVLHDYPDSNIARDELLMRLAVAQARVGDLRAAEAALKPLRADPPRGSRQLLAMIERDVKTAAKSLAEAGPESSSTWPMALGGASRTGHMKAPSVIRSGSDLTELWSRDIDLGFAPAVRTSSARPGSGGFASGGRVSYTYSSRLSSRYPNRPGVTAVPTAGSYKEIISRWKRGGWRPAGQVLLDGQRMYVKSRTQLLCIDTESNAVAWKSLWKTEFQLDGKTKKLSQMRIPTGPGKPTNALDVQLFGDQVHHSMTLANGLVFNIEGAPYDDVSGWRGAKRKTPVVSTPSYYRPQVIRRTRTNWLTAYDAKTGKLKWHRGAIAAKSDGETDADEVGFLAAPVPYARFLLAPVTNGGEIWMHAIDQKTGKDVWKTYLCDEPQAGCSAWSPVGVSVDSGDAYVATGAGVIFALDAMNGSVRWAFRYPRVGRANPYFQQRYGYYGVNSARMLNLAGMDEDVVIPHGRVLAVMPSDFNQIFAIDRRTGDFLWDTPLQPSAEESPAKYCIGVYQGGLYVAGGNVVRRYNLKGGRFVWQKTLENKTDNTQPSLGRGVVTDEAVYIPVKDSVLKLAHADGKELDQFGVVLHQHQPVGNLYSDGERLFVLGPGRISALGDIRIRVKALDKRVASGDWKARLERMVVRARTNNVNGALEDLCAALPRVRTEGGDERAAAVLLKALADMELPANAPSETLQVLTGRQGLFGLPKSNQSVRESRLRARDGHVRAALLRLKRNGKAPLATLLNASPLYRDKPLFGLARHLVRKSAKPGDVPLLLASLKTTDANRRRLAIAGVARLKQDGINPALKSALKDGVEHVRMDAALALANRGDRAGLPVLVSLLESPNLATRIRAASSLYRMSGQSLGFLAYESSEKRATAVKRWRDWLKTESKTASLRPVSDVRLSLGRTLIANQGQNSVVEYDQQGRETKRISLSGATGVQGLPDGHRLVASYSQYKVFEYDENWKPIREISTRSWGMPYSVQRLENGNTLVACYPGGQTQGNVVEFDPSGKLVWRFAYPGYITHAQRLENGNTLVTAYQMVRTSSGRRRGAGTSAGKVVEVDREKKVVREFKQVTYPWSARRLDNGNTLITNYNQSRVQEYDLKGKLVWQKTGVSYPRYAERLENGNTLIGYQNGVIEIDRNGRTVWSTGGSAVGGVSRY